MMTLELISVFESESQALRECIENDQLDLVEDLDCKVVKAFDLLLNSSPQNVVEYTNLVEFCVSFLLKNCEQTEYNQRVGDKLIELSTALSSLEKNDEQHYSNSVV